jgi:DNA invertase Pin-like site-specific DNA recombinase
VSEPQKRAVFYTRVSTKKQGEEGTSLETQRERCLAYIERSGFELVGPKDGYVDKGVSGAKEELDRPSFAKMMEACRAGGVDVVVVAALDRFSRHLLNQILARNALKEAGVKLHDLNGEQDELTADILGAVSADVRRTIQRNMTTGREATVRQGYWHGGPAPYGFQLEARANGTKHTKLVLHPQESATIRTAVAEILGGRSVYDTARLLNELHPPPRRAKEWTYHGLRRLLLEAQISGKWRYNRPKTWKRGLSEGQYEIDIERIITPQEHTQLHAILTGKSWTRAERVRFFLLSRGVLVSECGLNRYGKDRKGRGTYSYLCMGNPHNGGPGPKGKSCDCRSIPGAWLDGVVWSEVHRLFADPDHLVALADEYVQRQNQAGAPDDLGEIERQIAQLTEERTTIGVKKLREGVDPSLVNAAVAQIDGELAGLAARAKRAKSAAQQKGEAQGRLAQLRTMATRASERLDKLTDQERRVVLDALELRVEVLGWSPCGTCEGRGKVKGGKGGLPCPGCGMAKEVPRLRISGIWTSDLDAERGSNSERGVDAPYTGADVRAETFPATPGASFGSLLFVGATRP